MTIEVTSPGAGIAIVTIARPERRNAVDTGAAAALLQAFERIDADNSVPVAILTGRGGNFCAGADLKAVAGGDRKRLDAQGPGPMGPTRLGMSKPVIAAVEGYAVAGGLELAIWADMRIASETAVFGVFCRRFGVPLVDLGTIRLPRLIGHGRAMDLILTGRPVNADEAYRIGLANRIVSAGKALEAAIDLARTLSALPQRCLRNDRLSAIAQWDLTTEEAMRFEIAGGIDTLSSGEALEGALRFESGAGRHGETAL